MSRYHVSLYDDVGRFHERFRLARHDRSKAPCAIEPEVRDFRLGFLREELAELEDGYREGDLAKIADALADLVYVALGTAHLHQIPWDEVWAEVQRSNMTKERCELDHLFVPGHCTLPCTHPADYPCACHCHGCPTSPCVAECCHNRCAAELLGRPCLKPEIKHSRRGNANDVIKPAGWTPPNVAGVLRCADPARPERHFIDAKGVEVCGCSYSDRMNGAHANDALPDTKERP